MKNIGQLMKQAQAMQEKMAEMQAQLEAVEMTGVAGGGMVQVTLNGKSDMQEASRSTNRCSIPDETEVLEDLIVAAFNDARRKVSAYAEEEMQKLTGGLQPAGRHEAAVLRRDVTSAQPRPSSVPPVREAGRRHSGSRR